MSSNIDCHDCASCLPHAVIAPGYTTIGNSAFYSCSSLVSVTIHDAVTTIGNDAFNNCGSLTLVTIGDAVTTIGDGAFYDSSSLTSVVIGNSVVSIGTYAFFSGSLSLVVIPLYDGRNITLGATTYTPCPSGSPEYLINSDIGYDVQFACTIPTGLQFPAAEVRNYVLSVHFF